MDHLEQYLESVRQHLPWQRQDDVLAELRANLESQKEDKEEALGRALTDAEITAWLKEIGAPMQVAARFRPQQYLIGPGLFPQYWFVLRLACFWSTLIFFILSFTQMVAENSARQDFLPHFALSLLFLLLKLPWLWINVAAWVTLVFSVLEYVATRWPEKMPELAGKVTTWPAENLPPAELKTTHSKHPRTRPYAIFMLICSVFGLLWLLLVPKYPILIGGVWVEWLHQANIQLAPVWWQAYWWIVALNVVQIGIQMYDLATNSFDWPNSRRGLIYQPFGFIPLYLLALAPRGELLLPVNPADPRSASAIATANISLHSGMVVAVIFVSLVYLWRVFKFTLERYKKSLAASH